MICFTVSMSVAHSKSAVWSRSENIKAKNPKKEIEHWGYLSGWSCYIFVISNRIGLNSQFGNVYIFFFVKTLWRLKFSFSMFSVSFSEYKMLNSMKRPLSILRKRKRKLKCFFHVCHLFFYVYVCSLSFYIGMSMSLLFYTILWQQYSCIS